MRQALIAALFALLSLSAQATVYKVNGQVPEMFIGLSSDTKPVHGLHPGARFMESDTNNVYTWNGSDAPGTSANWVENYDAVTLGTKLAPERLESSTSGSGYDSVSGEWKATTVQTNASGDVTVYSGPAIVRIIRVKNTTDAGVATTNTAGIILVKDGSTVKDGAAAAKTPGSTIYDGLDGTQFRTSVVLNFASSSDNPSSSGKVEVLYRPLDPSVLW